MDEWEHISKPVDRVLSRVAKQAGEKGMSDTVDKKIFDEIRRDRDYWRKQAKVHQGEIERLEMMLTEANRAAMEAQRAAAQRIERERIFR